MNVNIKRKVWFICKKSWMLSKGIAFMTFVILKSSLGISICLSLWVIHALAIICRLVVASWILLLIILWWLLSLGIILLCIVSLILLLVLWISLIVIRILVIAVSIVSVISIIILRLSWSIVCLWCAIRWLLISLFILGFESLLFELLSLLFLPNLLSLMLSLALLTFYHLLNLFYPTF